MAQIIKYQQGGSTSKKYSNTFTYDGNKYNVDDDFINQLYAFGKTLRADVGNQFSKIIDAVKSGENIEFNSTGDGTIQGNINWDVTDNQDRRMGHSRRRVGRVLGSTWHGKEQDAREAISAFKNFKYIKPVTKNTEHDWSNKIILEYKKDKDGKYELVNGNKVFIQGANNFKALKRLDDLRDIEYYKDNDKFIGYKDNLGNKLEKKDYIDWYNRLGSAGVQLLKKRLEDGTWDKEDQEALNDIGIIIENEPTDEEIEQRRVAEETPEQKQEREARQRYKNAGWDYNQRNIFGVDDNGNITIIDPTLQSYVGTGDAWLNDEFREKYSAYADYIPQGTGLFVINGKVYRGNDLNTLNKIQKFIDFTRENRETAGNATNIKQYWNDTVSPWNSTSVNEEGYPMWSPYFQQGKFARDISGNYIRQQGDPLIFDYLENYDANNLEQFDPYGHPLQNLAKRVYIDPVTKQIVDYSGELQPQISKEAIETYYNNPNKPTAFNPYYTIGNQGKYKQVANVGDKNNSHSGAALYYNPETGLYYYYDENPGNDNLILNSKLSRKADQMRDYYWNIDARLGDYLQKHPDVLANSNVKRLIGEIIQNPYLANMSWRRENNFESIKSQYPELYKIFIDLYKNQNLRYGNETRSFIGSGGNPELREITTPEALESLGLAYRIPRDKNGGIIKYQIGGVAANRKSSFKTSKEPIKQSEKKLRSAGEEKVIGDGTELTGSDIAELTALGADAAALGATFVPVYGNALSAGIGAAGSFTGFGADVARDGLDWGDVGNLALNLGLDAATLLPGIGTGAKATKVAKALKKSKALAKAVKYASTALSGSNAIAGLTTAWNNIQDGSWTIKDIRTVLNGVRGIANISRTKGNAKTKESRGDTITLKPQEEGLPTIKLNKLELESIQKAPQNSRADKLEELIISRLPKNTKTDHITDILSSYGIKRKGSLDWNWRKPLTFNRNATINTNQFKYDMIPGVYRNPNELGWWNWNRRAAIRDAKINKENPYFRPLHWETGKVSDLNSIQPITIPIYSNFAPDLGIFSNTPEERYYYNPNDPPIFYKKGGKVVKAETGTKIDYNKPVITDKIREAVEGTIQVPKLNVNDVKLNAPNTKKWYGINKPEVNHYINPDMILGIGDFVTSTLAINRSNQKMKDAIKKGMIGSQQQMPTEFYSTFRDNGLHRMYDDRIKTMRQYKTVTNDPNQITADRLMRDMNVEQMQNERDTKLSQTIDQYNDKLLAQKQQYANVRNQIVNENRNRWYQGLAQLDMADAQKVTQQAQNVKNLIYQLRENYAKDLTQRNQIEDKLNQINADIKVQNQLKQLFDEIGGFESMSDSEKELFGNKWQEYTAYKVPDRVANIRGEALYNYHQSIPNNPLRRYSWWPWFSNFNVPRDEIKATPTVPETITQFHKKGGKIQRFRDVDEQAYLDQQKAINKAVNDLNNNIIRLFIKMMS